MEVIPAIDLLDGRCVRLEQGDFSRATFYDVDPVELARSAAQRGAKRLHVVDLDAARDSGDNRGLVERIVRESGLEVQVAGGARDRDRLEAWFDAGAAGVVMGTAAVRDPELLTDCATSHPGRVLAALDLLAGRPAVKGWQELGSLDLEALLNRWEQAPLAAVILTSVDRDGTLQGPDVESLRRVRRHTSHWVLYSGGIASADDIRALGDNGAAGVILGKALLEGRIELEDALAAV
ncbi:MAG TPA: 1-(5-phosphoribosyl)-5-[(5-phosphoribosylamino)methylideneamino] imidazole-4-carboxamide isomerase [Candidatus Dormibacteraeota bacterium]